MLQALLRPLQPLGCAAIVLKYYEQRTEAEIAGILGCRPGTVGSLVSRGLTGLRAALTLEGGGS